MTRNQYRREARDRALAMVFFMNSNENKYAVVYKQDCHTAMSKGRDEYPVTVIEAHTELEDYPKLYQLKGNSAKYEPTD